ncbi:unnamed protein product, partial [Darwinula stevensoni]
RCRGLSEEEFTSGSCREEAERACAGGGACPKGHACMPAPSQCLFDGPPCRQHVCVPISEPCDELELGRDSEVCDILGETHPSLCHLLARHRVLAHSGPCYSGCSRRGPVCGLDGETYPSECHAWGAGTQVDYRSPCEGECHPGMQCRG